MSRISFPRKLPGALSNLKALGLILLVTLGTLAVWVLEPIPLQNLRLSQFDQFQRWHLRPYTPQPVRIVDIDEPSLDRYGQWPWPRTRIAELVKALNETGAAAIAFDVLLIEPDRTSPAAMAQLWQNRQVSRLLQQLPDHDVVLGQALTDRRVVLGSSLSRTGVPQPSSNLQMPYRIIPSGDPQPEQWLHGYDNTVNPLPVLFRQAQGIGALNFATDADGVVRRVPLLLRLNQQMVPTLSAESLRVAQGARNHLLRSNQAGVQDMRIGALTIPTNARAEVWLHYTADEPARYVSVANVLDGKADANLLKDHIVLIGSSAAGLMDLRFNPLGQVMPGVQAHAMALEQMLAGYSLLRPAWARGAEALAMVLGALLIGLIALGAPAKWAFGLTTLMLVGVLGGSWYAFVSHQLLLDAVNPAIAMIISFSLSSGMHHLVSEREQRWVREAFSRYVSPNRVNYLVQHPDQLQLGGQRQTCSFIFTDLADFTSLIESDDPAKAVSLLNDYLDAMVAIVFKFEGTLDRIVGDAVVVMFSAPVQQEDHCWRAMQCALEMDEFATAYAIKLQAQGIAWGITRIGVHSGEVIVGNFGGKTLLDYRALGDPINAAARLESVNKQLGTRMCVSQDILDNCPPVPARYVARLVLKGKTKSLSVYEPLATSDMAASAPLDDYTAAVNLLRPGAGNDPIAAREQFERLAERYPKDPLVGLHLDRLRQGASDEVIVMTTK
ncbi:MAG: CHASE2 domain-containing protein [Hylemonella sp.]